METRSSYVLVGAVVVALAIALFAFILWLARFDGGTPKREYDVLFGSVSGLATGSAVQFQGVPVGQVQSINLIPKRPDRVRVRIVVNDEVPVLQGTRATVAGVGFTGVSVIELEGAMAGQAAIEQPGPWGRPVIPTRAGALAGLLESAPELLNNASTLLRNLNEVLNEQNRAELGALLQNLNSTSKAFEARAPEIAATLAESRLALRQAGVAVERIGALADSTSRLIDDNGNGLAADLRQTTKTANVALGELGKTAAAARPGMESLSRTTVPEANALLRDLRTTNNSLGAVAGRLDEDPLGALVGGRSLPDYQPGGGK